MQITTDPTTQSNYPQIATTHVLFEWTIDFEKKLLSGFASHDLLVKQDGVNEAIFDTWDLDISKVEVEGNIVHYTIKPKHAVMGSALHVPLPPNLKSKAIVSITVYYKTTQDSTALQWLDKEQTQGKKFPCLFSQCQPIYARALAPVQDTPSVKATYSAKVNSVLPVLLSAIRKSPPSDGPAHGGKVIGKDLVTYIYDQPIPIPSYLIAIAAYNVRYRAFPKIKGKSWTCGVWAEPELIDAAYWEFSEDTAKFLAAEEEIVGPYRFGVYDLLVLPPSFPYGGMENPCLSFMTPTLLAGDRSLVDVVVHELTHSYFGNGVTHADASHFWLNEGWTTYTERLLQELLLSPAHRGMAFVVGYNSLIDALKQFEDEPRYQRLVIDFSVGEDPDHAFSRVPYEKGANLILHLERTVGGLEAFLPYMKDYVNTFMGQSITTDQWKEHLFAYFKKHGTPEIVKALNDISWNAWFYDEGLTLPVKMEYDLTLAKEANDLAERWNAARSETDMSRLTFKSTDLDALDPIQILVFLETLEAHGAMPSPLVFHLDKLYRLSTATSPETRLRFYQIVLQDPASPVAQHFVRDAANWVVGHDEGGVLKGRMKFCRPIFRLVAKVDRNLAVSIFRQTQYEFHPIARKLIEKDLGLA